MIRECKEVIDDLIQGIGPKSSTGKEIASQNALKHGLLAKALVVQGEKKNAYEESTRDFRGFNSCGYDGSIFS